jgi:hypothetical protein
LICEVMTHLNSACKGLFAGIYFVKVQGLHCKVIFPLCFYFG